MIPVATLLTGHGPSAEQAETRDLIHEVCRAWDAGTMPLVEVRSRTTGAERFLAMRLTDPASPMWGPMGRLFAALVATDPTSPYGMHYATRQGVFSRAELAAAMAREHLMPDGRLQFVFPIRQPIDGSPVYLDTFEARFAWANHHERT